MDYMMGRHVIDVQLQIVAHGSAVLMQTMATSHTSKRLNHHRDTKMHVQEAI
jgi:hypothetical protein